MPFCPSCKSEYVEGITRCPDCDVDLVDKLPEPNQNFNPSIGLVDIASYFYPIDAEMAKLKLDSAGIESYIANEITTLWVPSNVMGTIRLLVREEDAENAIEVLNQKDQ